MFDLKNKLEIQDLIKEMEENKINYGVIVTKNLRKGEITYLDIRIAEEGEDDD